MKTEEQWFNEAYAKYHHIIFVYANNILKDVNASNEVTQQTFIRLSKKGQSVEGYLLQWLKRVCKNAAIDYIDAQQKYIFVEDNEDLTLEPHRDVYFYEDEEKTEYIKAMLKCIDRLKPKQQMMIRLYYFKNKSYKEIGKIMRESFGNVSFTISYAKSKLREHMKKAGFAELIY